MLKTIDDLIQECTTTSTEYFDGRGNVTATYFNKHKFAELIVRECAEWCDDEGSVKCMLQQFGLKR